MIAEGTAKQPTTVRVAAIRFCDNGKDLRRVPFYFVQGVDDNVIRKLDKHRSLTVKCDKTRAFRFFSRFSGNGTAIAIILRGCRLRIREDGGQMNFFVIETKIFAFLFLIFVNSLFVGAQSDSIFRLPAGTKIRLSMDSEISSKVSVANDTFTTTVAEPLSIRESIVLPTGTVIEGRIMKVAGAGFGGRDGKMQLRFETIRFSNNQKREIDGHLVSELGAASSQTGNIFAVLGGTALGAIIGSVSKSNNGLLIGAGIGAGAGTGVAVLRKGKDVRIRTDEEFEIELKQEVTLPVSDY